MSLRNPWGGRYTEWMGAWADGSPEWTAARIAELAATDQEGLRYKVEENGEFWMHPYDIAFKFDTVQKVLCFDHVPVSAAETRS